MRRPPLARALALAAGTLALLPAGNARAFCGFYVDGAGSRLFNDATQVVLMREGTRTVLSMQNTYKGPVEEFAMVVPVPVVLQKENVKTLPREVFDRLDRFTAPRLVEYWEQDPCPSRPWFARPKMAGLPGAGGVANMADSKVKVEARFAVGEYEAVVLSSQDALALDTWLREGGYKIPDGAEPILRPYVQGGMKFFAAKVDPKKVKFENGQAVLSPIRFHYDTEGFSLPIRLGLVNSPGVQDLIVTIVSSDTRYEVANYPNVFIPTNLDVDEKARDQFSTFYTALFDATLAKNPGAAVTELAWGPQKCDPCPPTTPTLDDLASLGDDVLEGAGGRVLPEPGRRALWGMGMFAKVITRMHLRYGRDSIGQDLVFRKAKPVVGGRGTPDSDGSLDRMVHESSENAFQGRYVIRHPWQGSSLCLSPEWGNWGGPPGGASRPAMEVAADLGHASHQPVELAAFLPKGVSEMGVEGKGAPLKLHGGGCAGCELGASTRAGGLGAIAGLLGLAGALARRLARGSHKPTSP